MLYRKLRTFLLLSWGEKALAFEALAWLGLMRLAVLTLPFKRVASWLGKPGASLPAAPLSPPQGPDRCACGARRTPDAAVHTLG